ncbi:PREDICTED: mitochondrial ubiquitin ligase activator of NFKB 1 [Wasmannia auropunctata]|uniref:mitochondrial ubiquitin ligase activator of NFKB 1 n=1 Tax=Wasmannia auropunctata TaxID=64793 RepID=UPI0005EF3D8A|nr:PREDICTED: mitochondrial ubiquitin ligase activator of NFKB 1 [Wasmannia auropunctata]XP_011687516.1 PREDICTED: mitochondrial ubiquitin ligase activator of NFKB 1 [Wasmannia auropunctata]
MEYFSEIFLLGIDTIVFTICLKQYIHYKNAIKAIKSVELHDIGTDLENLLDKSPNNKVDYIAIKGVVKPLGESLQSVNKKGVTGVIQKLSVREHVVARTSAGYWSDQERTIHQVYHTVPFVLQNRWYSVEITDPLSAEILDLDIISDQFQPSVPTIIDHVWGFFTGVRQRGIQSTEKMLREDSIITTIGELSRSKTVESNYLTLQPPLNGPPFYITSMSITSLIRKLDDRKKIYRIFCLMSGTIGLVLGGIMARRYWKNKQEQRLADQLRQSLETSRQERRQRVRDRDLREDQICVVCKTNAREIILLPCGHVCICEDCSVSINNNCPVCRTQIIQKAAAYIV